MFVPDFHVLALMPITLQASDYRAPAVLASAIISSKMSSRSWLIVGSGLAAARRAASHCRKVQQLFNLCDKMLASISIKIAISSTLANTLTYKIH